jgi:hypothetical protein
MPYIKASIQNSFLFKDEANKELTECYIIGAHAFLNRPLLFTCHLSTGALFSGVPINHLSHSNNNIYARVLGLAALQPWGCLGDNLGVVRLDYLKDYDCLCKIEDDQIFGRYLCTFFFKEGGHLEEDPEQMKTMNMIALENGQFALLPNNRILFTDSHFTEVREFPKYKRNTEYFLAGG